MLLLLICIFSLFPLPALYRLADYFIYPLLRYIVRYRLDLVRKNISRSFPHKSAQEQAQIVDDFYHHFSSVLVEIIYGYRASDEEMRQRVVFENMEMLEELAHRKHGVIAYLGHVCNWEWIADVGKQFNDPTIVEHNVYRRLKNPRANRAMLLLRGKRGGECVEKNQLLRKLVQLRHADYPFVIGLIADQKPSPRNAHVWTTFLHQDTAFLDGGETLARKFDLGVIYVHIQSPKRGYYRIHFELITDDPSSMPQDSITLTYARLLEDNICQQPHAWLWTHNRWKWKRENSTTA
jgi:KDO2-lipid IV(A) lauroyltransferase